MGEWKEYRMEELIEEIAMGPFGSNIKVDCFTDKGIPVLNGSNLVGFKLNEDSFNYVTEEKADSLGHSNAYRDDIVVTHRGTLGQIVYIPKNSKHERYVISQSQFRFKCNRQLVDIPYLVYYFHSREGQYKLLANASQVGVPALARPTSTFKDIQISLPSLPTQRRIASILASLDDKIDLLHRENATLEQMAETLFRQWFVVEAKEEWKDVLLGDLIDIGSGKGLQRSDFVENGLYSILGANGEIGKTNKYLVSESDRVIYTGRVGTLGNVFRIENKKAWLSDNTLVVRPKDYYYFVYFVLKCARLQDFNVGSTQPLIRQSDIKEIEISLPDGNSLKAFEKECNDIYKKIDSNNNQIQTLIQTRDGLLPRLMGGEIKV